MFGTNGLHQALVANGAEGVAGSITVAKGGDWDLAGGYLVQKAGGEARGISVDDVGSMHLEDALCVGSCDFLVTANNVGAVEQLCEILFDLRS